MPHYQTMTTVINENVIKKITTKLLKTTKKFLAASCDKAVETIRLN